MDNNDMQRLRAEQEGAVFYYDRKKRLERMPKNASLYDGSLTSNRGFFRVLTAAPGGKFLLTGIGMLVAVILLLSVFNKSNTDTIDAIPVSLTAFSFEDTIYVTVKLAENQTHEPCSVMVNFTALDKNQSPVELKQVQSAYTGTEQLVRITFLDYDIAKISAVIDVNDLKKTVSVLVDR